MTIYGIGGLGADERVFERLNLVGNLKVIEWVPPHKKDTIDSYARRLLSQIDHRKPFSLIGVSFGGMLAQSMIAYLQPKQLILISTACQQQDIPFAFRWLGKKGMFNFIPKPWLKPPGMLAKWLFSIKHQADDVLLQAIIKDTDPDFLRWALQAIARWRPNPLIEQYTRIHGTTDRLLNAKKDAHCMMVKGAGHFMIVTHAAEVSESINRVLQN